MRLAIAVAAALAVASGSANAYYDCKTGSPGGSTNPKSHPEEVIQCQILGRAFCIAEEDRIAKHDVKYATDRAAEWMNDLGKTGSHAREDNRKLVAGIASYVYAREPMLPWTAYWSSVYSCGFNNRAPPAQAGALRPKWDKASAECTKKFPGAGDGSENQPLRDCLYDAMKSILK